MQETPVLERSIFDLHEATEETPFLQPDVYAADCPSRGILDHVTSRWGVLVLILLLQRTFRFGELNRTIGGVSAKMLAQTLHTLEGDGFVVREVIPTKPPQVQYSLSSSGREVAGHIQALTNWVEANVPNVLEHRTGAIKGG